MHMNLFSKKKASKGTGIVTRRGGLIDRIHFASTIVKQVNNNLRIHLQEHRPGGKRNRQTQFHQLTYK